MRDLNVNQMRRVELAGAAKQAGLDACAQFRLQQELQQRRRVNDDHTDSRSSRITVEAGVFRITRFRPCSLASTSSRVGRASDPVTFGFAPRLPFAEMQGIVYGGPGPRAERVPKYTARVSSGGVMLTRLGRCGFVVVSAVVGMTTACARDTPPPSSAAATPVQLEKVKILLDWKAEPTYSGFFIAKEQGAFSRRGLDVEIVEGTGATVAAQLVGAGTYSVASSSGEATAIARAKGIPVRSLAVFYPDVPTVIYSRADAPIREPKDLVGKRIGIASGSITLDEYRGLLTAQHIDRSTITEVETGFDVAPLLQKQVDGLMNYQEMTPVELRVQGHDIVTMRFADYGLKAYSLNLISNDSTIASRPDLLRKIVEATTEGYAFVRSNPAEAAAMFSRLFPDRQSEYVKASIAEVAKQIGTPVGAQTGAGWTQTIATLGRLNLLATPVTVGEVAAEGFLK